MFALIALIVGVALASQGQTVLLKVASMGSKQNDKTTTEDTGNAGFRQTTHTYRQETIEITLRNTFTGSVDYVVEWMFLSCHAKGGNPEPCSADGKTVTLAANAGSTFQVSSPKLEATQSYQHSFESHKNATGGRDQRETTRYLGMDGVKTAGFVVRVKVDGKIIAVAASDVSLERRYQNPTAPWTPSEKSSPKKKPSRK